MTTTKQETAVADGTQFLRQAKVSVHDRIAACLTTATEQGDDLRDYTVTLFAEVWPVVERQLKQSYKNGLANAKQAKRTKKEQSSDYSF